MTHDSVGVGLGVKCMLFFFNSDVPLSTYSAHKVYIAFINQTCFISFLLCFYQYLARLEITLLLRFIVYYSETENLC
jgi:hypothetical protein